jgi:hypothetical protein
MYIAHFFSRLASIGALCTLVFFASCAVQGPAGPAGPQGPIGPVGPQGPGGASARVVNITVAAASWMARGVGAPGAYLQSGWFNSSNITTEIMNSGVVLAYSQVNDPNTPVVWQQLPITLYGGSAFRVVDFQYQAGQVQFFYNSSDGNAPPRPTGALTYRIIAISGTTTAKLQEQVDITNYTAVKNAFHLAE